MEMLPVPKPLEVLILTIPSLIFLIKDAILIPINQPSLHTLDNWPR